MNRMQSLIESKQLFLDPRAHDKPRHEMPNIPEVIGSSVLRLTGRDPQGRTRHETRKLGTKTALGFLAGALSIAAAVDLSQHETRMVVVPEQGIYGEGGQVTDIAAELREQGASVPNLSAIQTVLTPDVAPGSVVIHTDRTGKIAELIESVGAVIDLDTSQDSYKIEDNRFDVLPYQGS